MQSTAYTLVIGDKNYSSWSLRPWLAMTKCGIPFSEEKVKLKEPNRREQILAHSPSGLVPALIVGDMAIWDTLAILEYLAEQHGEAGLWPETVGARAMARSVAAEMHSGFFHLRDKMPMDFTRVLAPSAVDDRVAADVTRIVAIWHMCRAEHGDGGEFLFGDFSVADAMYAPVASRFQTYGVDLAAYGDDGTAAAYRDHVLAMPELAQWADDAERELVERGETV